jgi:predicted N-formylglutamate amidohydrolase
MDSQTALPSYGETVVVSPSAGDARILLICEHASNRIPDPLHQLGLTADVLESHVAWDPGALGVARALAGHLDASLVSGAVSRLVYDCNRPPEAPSAIPERSEVHDIPGNRGLSAEARAERVAQVYRPFEQAVAGQIAQAGPSLALVITVHSFTPVFHDKPRPVQIGILHGSDDRFAMAMMQNRPAQPGHDIRLNEPYGAADGVTHTLELHGCANGLFNVMIEIRNDLIASPTAERDMAAYLAAWISTTANRLGISGVSA